MFKIDGVIPLLQSSLVDHSTPSIKTLSKPLYYCRDASVTFPVAVTKYSDKSKLKKNLLWLTVRVQPIIMGNHGDIASLAQGQRD